MLWALWALFHVIKCNVHLEIVKLTLKNLSINVLFSRTFNFGTLVGGSNFSPQADIKITKIEKNNIFKLIVRLIKKLKMSFQKYILKASFMMISKMAEQLNLYAEMMEQFGVEVGVKIVKNILVQKSFYFGTVVEGLNISSQASKRMTKMEKNMLVNSIFRPYQHFF